MSALLQLPDDICNEILYDWLGIKGLGLLDASISGVQRELLHRAIRERGINVIDQKGPFGSCFFNWILIRKLKLKGLNLNGRHFNSSHQLAINVDPSFVEEVNVEMSLTKNQNTLMFLNKCNMLRVLRSDGIDNLQLLESKVLRTLEQLEVDYGDHQLPGLLANMQRYCRNLRILSINTMFFDDNREYLEILRLNPNLIEVNITCNQEVIQVIIAHCPAINRVGLRIGKSVELSVLRELLAARPSLQYLQCTSEYNSFRYISEDGLSEVHLGHISLPFRDSELVSLLSLIHNVTGFSYFTLDKSDRSFYPDEVILHWLSRSKHCLTYVELSNVSHTATKKLLIAFPTIILMMSSAEPEMYDVLLKYGVHLRGLALSACEWLSFDCASSLMNALPRLEEARFGFFIAVTDTVWNSRETLECASHIPSVEFELDLEDSEVNVVVYQYGKKVNTSTSEKDGDDAGGAKAADDGARERAR